MAKFFWKRGRRGRLLVRRAKPLSLDRRGRVVPAQHEQYLQFEDCVAITHDPEVIARVVGSQLFRNGVIVRQDKMGTPKTAVPAEVQVVRAVTKSFSAAPEAEERVEYDAFSLPEELTPVFQEPLDESGGDQATGT